jgi:hypothetical protein
VEDSILSRLPGLGNTLLWHALEYRAIGFNVIPTRGKKAAGKWKRFQRERPDELALQHMFALPGITGVAAILGAASSGLACRDFDRLDRYQEWASQHPDLATVLPTVATAKGRHVYFRSQTEQFITFDDGEFRADCKHFCVLPPSLHPDGPSYRWLIPLPDGPLPIIDPRAAGLLPPTDTTTQQLKQPTACVTCTVTDAIKATIPDGPGQRNRKVFDLARRLKSISDLDTSPEALKAVVFEWHRRALPFIRTKAFAETWSDFQTAWLAVKAPHRTALHFAYAAARRLPHTPIDDCAELGVLAALCWHLSASGARPFFLACSSVKELLGVSRMTAWRWLRSLQFYGLIEPIETGTLKGRQATTWRYIEKGSPK